MMHHPDIKTFKALYEYITLQDSLITTKDTETKRQICQRMIALVPVAIRENTTFNEQTIAALRANNESAGIKRSEDYYKNAALNCVNAVPYKTLAVICEKEGDISQAIYLCEYALSLGFDYDGTKGGMSGRLQRLMKKR